MTVRRWLACAIALLGTAVLSGCWNAQEVQDANYVTALGIDIEGDKYVLYAQMLDFSNVSKQETKSTSKPHVWTGKGFGDTLNGAMNDLYNTSQQRVVWGHNTAIVVTDKALAAKKLELFDMMNRFREFRYNVWLYGTREQIDQILLAVPFFNLTPQQSILHEPLENFEQHSDLPPQYMFRFIADYREPASSAYVPSISLNKQQWEEDGKPHRLLELDGAFFLTTDGKPVWVSKSKLRGYPWLYRETVRAPLDLKEEGKALASLVLDKPKFRIAPRVADNQAKFRIKLRLTASLNELIDDADLRMLEKASEARVKEQILATYKEGQERQVDIFGLEETLYRKDPAAWRQLSDGGKQFFLRGDAIESLEIDVHLQTTGKYKLRS